MDERSEIYKVHLDADDANDVRAFANGFVQESSLVLDVGCACGDLGRLLRENRKCQVHGFEYNPGSIEIARKTGAYEVIHQVDLNALDPSAFPQYKASFDCIIVLDVLEHLIDPESSLKRLTTLLKPNGSLVVSLPNVAFCDIKAGLLRDSFEYTDTGILDRTHLRFFTRASISCLFTNLGLSVDSLMLKLCYHGAPTQGLPWCTRRMITCNPDSYVYQYVTHLRKSHTLNSAELATHNANNMSVDWPMIRSQYRVLRKEYIIAELFPVGSVRRRIARCIRQNLFSA